MPNSPKTERMEFPETGDWWEFRTYLTYGIEKNWLPKMVSCLIPPPGGVGDFEIDYSKMPVIQEATEGLLIACTVAWSYGEIKLDTLMNNVPASHARAVSERMTELYRPLVRENDKALLKNVSLDSKPAVQ